MGLKIHENVVARVENRHFLCFVKKLVTFRNVKITKIRSGPKKGLIKLVLYWELGKGTIREQNKTKQKELQRRSQKSSFIPKRQVPKQNLSKII